MHSCCEIVGYECSVTTTNKELISNVNTKKSRSRVFPVINNATRDYTFSSEF